MAQEHLVLVVVVAATVAVDTPPCRLSCWYVSVRVYYVEVVSDARFATFWTVPLGESWKEPCFRRGFSSP